MMITTESLRANIKAYRAKHGARRISNELKQEVVSLFKGSEKSVVGFAREVGISDAALGKWLREREQPETFRKLSVDTPIGEPEWLVEAPGGIRVRCQDASQVAELIKHLGTMPC